MCQPNFTICGGASFRNPGWLCNPNCLRLRRSGKNVMSAMNTEANDRRQRSHPGQAPASAISWKMGLINSTAAIDQTVIIRKRSKHDQKNVLKQPPLILSQRRSSLRMVSNLTNRSDRSKRHKRITRMTPNPPTVVPNMTNKKSITPNATMKVSIKFHDLWRNILPSA